MTIPIVVTFAVGVIGFIVIMSLRFATVVISAERGPSRRSLDEARLRALVTRRAHYHPDAELWVQHGRRHDDVARELELEGHHEAANDQYTLALAAYRRAVELQEVIDHATE